ncbi:MAG: L,D-transpeptidase family protein [Novosphingobium sp.]
MNVRNTGAIALGLVTLGLLGAGTALWLAKPPERPLNPRAVAAADHAAPSAFSNAAVAPAPSASTPAAKDERFIIKRILPISGPIKYGEWHWDEANVPDGPIVVTVDLEARVISIFRNGYEIGASAVLLGTQEKPTPTGVFPIMGKEVHHVSNLYDAPMPYMQRLTNDGITLHATEVAWGYASHGCIGMPEAFAKKVFETTHLGDKVYITRGKTAGIGDSLVGT